MVALKLSGSTVIGTEVEVKCKPKYSLKSFTEPVSFDTLSRNMTAKLGQQVTIECEAKGDDPIRIMWTRNGKPINPLTQR